MFCQGITVQVPCYYLPLHDGNWTAITILVQLHPEGGGRVDDVICEARDAEVVDDEADKEHDVRTGQPEPGGPGETQFWRLQWGQSEQGPQHGLQ